MTDEYARRIDESGRSVYLQLWFGLRVFGSHHNRDTVSAVTLRGPRDQYAWNLFFSAHVVFLGSRTFRHVLGHNSLFRHINLSSTSPIQLDDGMHLFTFLPCYIQVTGQSNYGSERHYSANFWDQGVTVYEDAASFCQLILVVDIGPTFTQNRQSFSATYSGMEAMWAMITNDEDDWDE